MDSSILHHNHDLLNCFIMQLLGFICQTQLYFIKFYNYIVSTDKFKKLYIKAANLYPILHNYDPEMLFIELLCNDKEDIRIKNDNIVVEEHVNTTGDDTKNMVETVDAKEIPIESDSNKMKKIFMAEMLKNPSLISNMTKMMGNIDPNVIKSFSGRIIN